MGTLQPGQGIAITSKRWRGWGRFPPPGPRIFINGQLAPPAGWGRTFHPLPPGRHRIHMFVPSGLTWFGVGPADYVARVHPGQVLELEYAPPARHPSRGSLGPGPQQHIGEEAYWQVYWRMMKIAGGVVAAFVIFMSGVIGLSLLLE